MSKEFEELVLKKLEKLDTLEEKISNTDKVIQEVILPKLDKLDILEEKTANTDKVIKEVILPKLDKLDSLEVKITNTDKTLQEISTELKNTQKELKITQEGLENLTNKFTVFDFEINKRIDTLFDAFTVNREKDLVHEKDINSLDEKVFNHSIRISNLENKILIA